MTTKNLSHTIIEGGRSEGYKAFVHFEKRSERRRVRVYCDRVAEDPDGADEALPLPLRPLSYYAIDPKFRDKTAPINGWLYAQVGKRWNDVYSLIRKRFDSRTVAGQHILFDHLLTQVSLDGDPYRLRGWRDDSFFVDEEGVLRLSDLGIQKHFHGGRYPKKKQLRTKKIVIKEWAKNRRVIDYGTVQYWTVQYWTPAERGGPCFRCSLYSFACFHTSGSLRQDVKFTVEESKMWQSLYEAAREALRWKRASFVNGRWAERELKGRGFSRGFSR